MVACLVDRHISKPLQDEGQLEIETESATVDSATKKLPTKIKGLNFKDKYTLAKKEINGF